MLRFPFVRALPIAISCLIASPLAAQPAPLVTSPALAELPQVVAESRSATWPLMLEVHALVGAEPHDRGTPVAFGAGAELLWRGRVGGFAELLASEGTPIIAPTVDGQQLPSFADRISVPFGVAGRPLAPFVIDSPSWVSRFLAGISLQLGITVEHVRTSDDAVTTAGIHAAVAFELPIYGGPKQGGLAVRLYGRLLFTPDIDLDQHAVYEPIASGQVFGGLAYYP